MDRENVPDYEDLYQLFRERRSVRSFKDEPVPKEDLKKIIDAGRHAPSGANSQPWEFIVVDDENLQKKIVDFAVEQRDHDKKLENAAREGKKIFPGYREKSGGRPGFEDASAFIIVCGDPRTMDAYPISAKVKHGEQNFYSSLANAFLFMHLAAFSLGLGTQWMSSIAEGSLMSFRVKELLKIPDSLEIYDMLAVGWPKDNPEKSSCRDLDNIAHWNGYDSEKYREDEEIEEFTFNIYGD